MKCEIKGKDLVITIPMQEPTLSASGKSKVIATTSGNIKTGVIIEGKEMSLGVNAYISAR